MDKQAWVIGKIDIATLPQGRQRYPFHLLDEIGKFFTVPLSNKAISSAAWSHGKKNGRKYTVRKTEDVIQVIRIE